MIKNKMVPKQLLLALILFLLLPFGTLNWCRENTFKTASAVNYMVLSPSGRYLAIAHTDNIIRFYLTDNHVKVGQYNPSMTINVIRFSTDGNYLAIGGSSLNVTIINGYEPFNLNRTFPHGIGGALTGLDFNKDSTKFITCGANATRAYVWLYNVLATGTDWGNATVSPLNPGTTATIINDCRVSPLDGKIAVATPATLYLYNDVLGATPTTSWSTASTTFSKIMFNPAGTSIMYIDRVAFKLIEQVIAETTPKPAMTVPLSPAVGGSPNILWDLDISSDGKYSAAGGELQATFIYDVNRSVVARWNSSLKVKGIAFNRNAVNRQLFIGDTSGQILILSFNCTRVACAPQFFLDTTGCRYCGDVLSKCIGCVNATVCDKCLDGFYLSAVDYKCKQCPMLGCLTCTSPNHCTECHSGFFIKTGADNLNTCLRCNFNTSQNMEGCAVCTSETVCIGCNNDYYLDGTICKLCSTNTANPHCLKCTNATVCNECMVGFWKNGNTCSPCSTNCLACEGSNSNCTQCARGWYVNIPTSYTCTRCLAGAGCLSCNNSNFCFQCQNGMYQAGDGTCAFCVFPCTMCEDNTICYACAEGYFLDGTTCKPCVNNCGTCNSTGYCTTCLPGYYNFTGNVCKACIDTYANCEYCSSSACQSCQPGYLLNPSTCQHCSEIMFKCEKCNSTTSCLSCLEGFYLTASTGNASCASCAVGCETCQNLGTCRKCFKQFYLHANNSCVACPGNCLECTAETTCVVCDEGYYLDGAVCKLCKVNMTNCLRCSNGTVCVDCETGFYLDSSDNKCKRCSANCVACNSAMCYGCQIGYYLTTATNPACSSCSQVCTQCTSATACTSCKAGFYLDGSSCKNCTLNRFCTTCNIATCYSCSYGYFLELIASTTNYKCSRCLGTIEGCTHCNATNYCFNCTQGYYRSSGTNLCVSCTAINGCQRCSDGTTCQLCGPGFFLNGTNKCQQCKIGCSTCDASGACFTCSPGFYLSSTNCVTCKTSLEGCFLCPTSATCTECLNGYYLDAGTSKCKLCRNTLVGCIYCNSSSVCTNCQPGFYLDTTNNNCSTCEKVMAGCEICKSNSVCLDCQNGYFLTGGGGSGCTLCTSTLSGCISCLDSSTCKACKSGFFLFTDNKCKTCFSVNSGCQTCSPDGSGGIICSQCSSGFYKNPSTNLCVACSTVGCSICDQATPSICLTCSSTYYRNGTQCSKCNTALQGCNQCSSSTQCLICDVGYYLDANNKCQLCQNVLNGCGKCQVVGGVPECTDCKSSYILDSVTKKCSQCFAVLQGCIYCVDETECVSCSNGYFKDSVTKLCRSCTEQPGCMLCANETVCEYCGPSYYIDHALSKCIKCSDSIPFCVTCLESTRCLSCQSGYFVTQKFVCQQVTVAAKQKVNGVKLITEFVNKDTLTHTLLVQNDQYSNVGYNLTGACTLYLTDYNQLSASKKISQVQLLIKDVLWISPTKIKFFTDNPTNLKANQMSTFRRLQQQTDPDNSQVEVHEDTDNKFLQIEQYPLSETRRLEQSSASNMGNFKVSLQMSQDAVNNILPNFYQTGDLVLDYSLDEPEFYTSFLKYESQNTTAQNYSFFGYAVTAILLLNFIYKTYKLSNSQNSHHYTGEILGHVFALKSISLFHYPITYEFYYFCYGFMLMDLPWFNEQIGMVLGEKSDFVPKSLAMYFYNLNIASTYILALALFVLLISVRFLIDANKELLRAKYTDFIYSIFVFGLTFAGCLSVQGAKFNPISQVTLNSVFYLIGIIVYLGIFIEILYSVNSNRQNFYKIRIFLKATLLSLGHLNPIIVVSMSVILDILLTALQFIVIERQVPWGKLWLVNNLVLDIALALMFLLPNSAISLYGSMGLVGIMTFMELLLTMKLMSYCEQLAKREKSKIEEMEYKKQSRMNETHENMFAQKDINYENLDISESNDDVLLGQNGRVQRSNRRNQPSEGGETRYTSFNKTGYQRQEDSSPEMDKGIKKEVDVGRMKKTRAVSFKKEQGKNQRLRVQETSFGNNTEYRQEGEERMGQNEENNNKTQVHFVQSMKNGGRRRGQGRRDGEA